ncbi:MAG: hypothetical protein HY429_04590 [Candidatus Levybacteria bacterium]|nr:hypothetical protein [Candidatus Levybacteria bacterium]
MKIIVTHASPDLDAVTSVWLIKRFLAGWEEASIQFVPAGERISNFKFHPFDKLRTRISNFKSPVETIGKDEVIHVDTGLGPLDHHETSDDTVSAASRTWDYIQVQSSKFNPSTSFRTGVQGQENDRVEIQKQAISRMVKVVVKIDHFKEVFWDNPVADYHEFSLIGILDGLKLQKPNQDEYYVEFCLEALEAILHNFENRIWAEREIKENGKEFQTRFGKGIGFETINDTVIKLSQKMGYMVVVRKDPRKGYVRIKAKPFSQNEKEDIDLTLVYEKLKKMDPKATWFLHVSKKMLLNGTAKNPKMIPTKLSLDQIISVLEAI